MKILVLAGGFDQIALIEGLKERGHEVLLADYLIEPVAKKYADKHFQVSTLDEKAIHTLAVDEKVDLITTACTDQALMTVAKVSEQLGLPCYLDAETARNVTDKVYMKEKFHEFDIPTAQNVVLYNKTDRMNVLFEDLEFPLVVKPCDCNSSKGVVKVRCWEELQREIDNAFVLSRSNKVIVERFMEGDEISIDVWKDQEGAKILSVSQTRKIKSDSEHFTIYQSKYPIEGSTVLMEKIQNIAEKISEAFALENCPILIQAIVENGDINVIEFSARMGGGSKYKLIEYISDINIMDVYINRILGNMEQIIFPKQSEKAMELNYVYADSGIFDELVGFNDACKTGDICELFQYKVKGSKIENRLTSSDRVLGFLIQDENSCRLKEKRYRILKQVDILDTGGNSIMYRDCFEQGEDI